MKRIGAWYEGGCVTMRLRYDSQAVRDSVLKSSMAEGVAAGFETLANVLATTAKEGE